VNTEHLKGKSVLVTGGTGTFGHAAIARLLAIPEVKKVIVFSRDEYKQHAMQQKFTDERVRFILGDIREKERLHRAFKGVDIVIHAAALKQVPAIEYNPIEAVRTNVLGTQNVIEVALDRDIPQVLVISSDKAVHPVNLYGATKLCAERLAISANSYRGLGKTKISAMRYGNVLGSRGSIVEIIENQRAKGVLELTDERMTRFWLSIDRVIDAVFFAFSKMEGGEIFVPKMKSLKVADLMRYLAPECKIEMIGMRPGEKLHEMLVTEHEAKRTKDAGDILIVLPEFLNWTPGTMFPDLPLYKGMNAISSNSSECLVPFERAAEVLGA
jgi:UDP-N-acetylglucosamine 4,6-dehydratase